jgi:ABC-type oligopeptide transport system substrate-binding subunit
MSIDFWKIVEAAKDSAGSYMDARPDALKEILLTISADEIVEFDLEYRRKLIESYRWDLWGAAYLINGGCSDDSFDYFRDFLISEGKEIYEAAIENPESLASLDHAEDADLEQYRYSIGDAYEEMTGKKLPINSLKYPSEPVGDEWEEEELEQMFPTLAKKYG